MDLFKTYSRRKFLRFYGMGAVSLSFGFLIQNFSYQVQKDSRPNIVIIMADDMGFSDAGCYGGEIDTPNLDHLAKNGLRFTQFYNCARCCPTRASLLTGLYPHQVGMARNGQNLSPNCITLPQALKSEGYNTAMVGKWHLSRTRPLENKKLHQKWLDHQYDPGVPFSPLETYPVNRGFDKHYGVIWGVINFFDPFSLVEGIEPIKDVAEDYYFTDAITDKAIEYIDEFSESSKPFFLYIAHCAPHWPLHALTEDIIKYKDRYKDGWEKLREERYQKQLKMGLFKASETSLPEIQDRGLKWDDLSEEKKQFQSGKMTVHAAMIDRLDQSVGRVLETLEKKGQIENTAIVFLSDNGASPEIPQRPGFDRSSQTRRGEPIRYSGITEPGSETTYTGIGPAWSSASNTPFRFWKKESFEGGCHTPFILHWPQGLKTKAGSLSHNIGHVMDIMPTCLDFAGASDPSDITEKHKIPLEGKNFSPSIKGLNHEVQRMLYFEHMGGRAVRIGDWKLVALNKGQWELYDLSKDRTEMTNLAEKYPEKVKDLREKWDSWAGKVNVPPPPG